MSITLKEKDELIFSKGQKSFVVIQTYSSFCVLILRYYNFWGLCPFREILA